jgi:hypothetical protein
VRNLRHVPLGVDLELFSPQRRAAARAHAERFGWPAAVRGFLAAHAVAARVEMAEEAVR